MIKKIAIIILICFSALFGSALVAEAPAQYAQLAHWGLVLGIAAMVAELFQK